MDGEVGASEVASFLKGEVIRSRYDALAFERINTQFSSAQLGDGYTFSRLRAHRGPFNFPLLLAIGDVMWRKDTVAGYEHAGCAI